MRAVILLALLVGCVPPKYAQYATASAAVAATWCDIGSTIQFREHGQHEANPIVGANPSGKELVWLGVMDTAIIVAANFVPVPRWLRVAGNSGVAAWEADAAWYNYGTAGTGVCGLGAFDQARVKKDEDLPQWMPYLGN